MEQAGQMQAQLAAAQEQAAMIAQRASARTPELLARILSEARAELAAMRVGAP